MHRGPLAALLARITSQGEGNHGRVSAALRTNRGPTMPTPADVERAFKMFDTVRRSRRVNVTVCSPTPLTSCCWGVERRWPHRRQGVPGGGPVARQGFLEEGAGRNDQKPGQGWERQG
jgi:hypothetical protein